MGLCTAEDIQDVLDSLAVVLPQVGFAPPGEGAG
jgi:hypothetical protein